MKKNKTKSEALLISPAKAAELLGVKSYKTVIRTCENNGIKIKFVNGRPRIVLKSLMNFINED